MSNEELVFAIKTGETTLVEQLWDQCNRFIRMQAFKWAQAWKDRQGFDVDDLIQSGFIALNTAINGFDLSKGCSFISYLDLCLKTEFSNVIGCRTPAQLKEPLNSAVSLDAPVYGDSDNEITLGETIATEDTALEEVDEAMFREYMSQTVRTAVNSLPERQRLVVNEHYWNNKTYEQIADMVHASKSYPAQLARDGIKRLRRSEHASKLAEIYYGDRNLYRHTSRGFFKRTGCSVQEYELIRRERNKKF